jgi:hypothetical protein
MTITVVVPSSMSYDGTQHTYTDDSDPLTGLDGGGHVDRMIPVVKDLVAVADYTVSYLDTNTQTAADWASLTTGIVDGTDYSSKAWSIGGTGVTSTLNKGASKEWATTVNAMVDTVDYSAKEYAIGTTVESSKRHASGTVATGSAKDWATLNTVEVVTGQGYSAKQYAVNAAASAASVSGVLSSVSSIYDQFDDRYLGNKATTPSVDNDGNTLLVGAMYFDTTANEMRVWTGSLWKATGSAVNGTSQRYLYTATASQTTFNATYDIGFVDVYLNGVKLVVGTDFTATNGTTVVLSTGATVGSSVDIVAYGAFNVANTYTVGQTDTLLAAKQATLVSGTNIKTVNSVSIIGSGDISIPTGISNIVTATTATTLTSTKTLLRITPTKHGEWVKLPDATTCDLGGVLHIIDNKSPYHVRVLNSNGLLLGFIFGNTVSNVSLSDKTTAAGVWTIENSELYGISATSTVVPTFSAINQIIAIDADREFILCTNSSGHPCGIAYNKTTNTFGSLTVIRAVNTNNNNRCVLSGANQILVVSCASSSTAFEAVTLTLSDTSITVNTAATATLSSGFSNGFPAAGAIIAVGSSFVTSYHVATPACQIRALTISGTTVTIGAATNLAGNEGGGFIQEANGTGVIAVSYTSSNFYTNYYGVSGITITAGTGTTTAGNLITAFPGQKLTKLGTRWVCTFFDNINGAQVGIISLSGTTTSISWATAFNNSGNITDAIVVGSNKILLVRSDGTNNVNIVTDVSGAATAGTPISVSGVGVTKFCLYVDGNSVFISESSASNTIGFFKIDCSGTSPVLTNRLNDCGLTSTNAVVFGGGGSNSIFEKPVSLLTGSKFSTSLPVGAYSQNPLEMFLIDGKVKVDVKKISTTGTNLARGKSDSERWIGSSASLSLTKLECIA